MKKLPYYVPYLHRRKEELAQNDEQTERRAFSEQS